MGPAAFLKELNQVIKHETVLDLDKVSMVFCKHASRTLCLKNEIWREDTRNDREKGGKSILLNSFRCSDFHSRRYAIKMYMERTRNSYDA